MRPELIIPEKGDNYYTIILFRDSLLSVSAEKEEIYTGSGILVLSPTHHIKEAKILEQGPDGKISSLIFSPKGINDTFTKFPDTFEYQALNDLKDGYRYMSLNIKIFETFINHFEVIDEISEKFATNRTTLNALFKKEYGTSAMDYLNNVRIQNASFMLSNTGLPITASNFIANITKLIADFSLNYLPSRFIICKNKKEGEICTNQNSIQYLKFLLLQAA